MADDVTGCRKQQFDADKQIVEACDLVYILKQSLSVCYIFPRLIRIDNSMSEQLGGCFTVAHRVARR